MGDMLGGGRCEANVVAVHTVAHGSPAAADDSLSGSHGASEVEAPSAIGNTQRSTAKLEA